MVLLQSPLQVEQEEQEQIELVVVLPIMLEAQQLTELVVVEVGIIIFHPVVIQPLEQAEQGLVFLVVERVVEV
jgi:hypothetical protein